jgi:hypothetical protein
MAKNNKKGTKRERVVLNITDEDFVTSWQKAASATEVAQELKVSVDQVHRKAMFMRKHNVPLKGMRRGRTKDWNALIEFTKNLPATR